MAKSPANPYRSALKINIDDEVAASEALAEEILAQEDEDVVIKDNNLKTEGLTQQYCKVAKEMELKSNKEEQVWMMFVRYHTLIAFVYS